MKKQGQPSPENAPAETTIDQKLASIKERFSKGELNWDEAMLEGMKTSAEHSTQAAQERMMQMTQEQKSAEAEQRFMEANPDFTQTVESGALDSYMKDPNNPASAFHDHFSAYVQYKADQQIAALKQEAAAAFEKGKQEGARISAGSDNASKVLNGAGNGPTQPQKPTLLGREEVRAGMLQELRNMRSKGQ